jgi:glycosyltransferase involved in cell wall biosynthesis
VADAAAERAYVHLALDAPRRRVERLLETHRYGLNCKPDEHFGLAVAEYVAAGMVAFAPDSGGQREILDGDRLFDGVEDAVDTVARAVAGGETPSPSRTFGGDGFAAAVRTHVDAVLDGG